MPDRRLPGAGLDPRGLRFAAGLTCVVLAAVVVTGNVLLLAAQVVVFLTGTAAGPARSPYGWLYRRAIRPRLRPPAELEDPAPPRFAQAVGLAVTSVALILAVLGVGHAAEVGAALAFVAAFLNAAVGYCLGCQLYTLIVRARAAAA